MPVTRSQRQKTGSRTEDRNASDVYVVVSQKEKVKPEQPNTHGAKNKAAANSSAKANDTKRTTKVNNKKESAPKKKTKQSSKKETMAASESATNHKMATTDDSEHEDQETNGAPKANSHNNTKNRLLSVKGTLIANENEKGKASKTTELNDKESDDEKSDSSEADSGEDDSEGDEEQTHEEDSDDDEEELEELLKKAQLALQIRSDPEPQTTTPIQYSLPKMDPGFSTEELYIKKDGGKGAKLTPSCVALVYGDEQKASNHSAIVTLKAKQDEAKRLTRKERQQEREKTSGKSWFDMPRPEITPEVKRDLEILKMRHVLDRKRHYKKMGKGADPKYFQVGTIVEGPTEFYSARLTKAERKQTIAEEILANDSAKQYYKRKFNETQERTNNGGKKHFKKLKAKQRRLA